MSRIFCSLENNGYVKDRIIFDSYEVAEQILGVGNFVEETEETGPIIVGGIWDGTTCTPPEPVQDVVEVPAEIEAPTE